MENWINRGVDRAAVTIGEKRLGNASEDADVGLDPDLQQSLVDGGHPEVVDDLGILHHLARCNVESGHISSNVGIADDRKNPGGHVEQVGDLSGLIRSRHEPKCKHKQKNM